MKHNPDSGSIDKVRAKAEQLGLLEWSCPIISITGTNGKGSVVACLESILLAQGYRVGAYTSPHLLSYNERIRINGISVADQELDAANIEVAAANCDNSLSYFEFTTLVALALFRKAAPNVLLLEVGIGGRLDPVNILDADLAIITTVDFDHTNRLGSTLEEIGREKSGIMRPQRPVIFGDATPLSSVVNAALSLDAPLYCFERDFRFDRNEGVWSWYGLDSVWSNLPLPRIRLQNAAIGLMALRLLQNLLFVDESAIRHGLEKVFVLGRFQIVANKPLVIVDVAHNPQATAYLAQQLRALPCSGKTYAVVGMLSDKDVFNSLKALLEEVAGWYVCNTEGPRGARATYLADCLRDLGQNSCYTHASVMEAFQSAKKGCKAEDRIVVFGSFLTVAAILEWRNKCGYAS